MIDKPQNTPLERARAELKALGVTLRIHPGGYVVLRSRVASSAYTTDDFDDAVARGREMAGSEEPVKRSTPPLGPMGSGSGRKAKIYRHNRKVAARRQKNEATRIEAEVTTTVKRVR